MTNLINEYKKAVFNLAIEMEKIRKAHNRKVVEDISGFDICRITWFFSIASTYNSTYTDLLPEHFLEVYGMEKKEAGKYLNIARQKKLKPLQLRKLIRKHQQKTHNYTEKVKVSSWGKNMVLLENDIKNMNDEEKKRALSHLANTLLKI